MSKSFLIIFFSLLMPFSFWAQSNKAKKASIKSSLQVEDRIIDTMMQLKEVRQSAAYVEKQSKGKRHLGVVIYKKPSKKHKYYWVKTCRSLVVAYI